MRQISKKNRQTVAAVSISAVLIGILILVILDFNAVSVYENEIFLAAILEILIPSALLDFENQRWVSAIENQMPLLVRGVSESQETGLTLVKALEKVVDNKMIRHPLSDEVRQITIQMSWGASFEEALTNFKERVNSPIVNRFCARSP